MEPYIFISPKTASLANESHTGSVSTTKIVSDFEMNVNVKTEKQSMQNSQPLP